MVVTSRAERIRLLLQGMHSLVDGKLLCQENEGNNVIKQTQSDDNGSAGKPSEELKPACSYRREIGGAQGKT